MIRLIVVAGTAAACFASPAIAQESRSFSGFHIGAVVGLDSAGSEVNGERRSEEGISYGVAAGYDAVLGDRLTLGAEAEIGDSSVEHTQTDFVTVGGGARAVFELDKYVGLRAGYVVGSSTAIYAKAGYTNQDVELVYFDGAGTVRRGDHLPGYRLGAGIEFSLAGSLSLRGEYRYSDYSEFELNGIDTGVSFDRHQFVAGLLLRL